MLLCKEGLSPRQSPQELTTKDYVKSTSSIGVNTSSIPWRGGRGVVVEEALCVTHHSIHYTQQLYTL